MTTLRPETELIDPADASLPDLTLIRSREQAGDPVPGRVDGLSITNGYDVDYTFDGIGRLSTVQHSGATWRYGYDPLTGQVQQLQHKKNNLIGLRVESQYDTKGRLASIHNHSLSEVLSYTYTHDAADRRTKVIWADGSWWDYGYDARNQVTSGIRKWPDGTPNGTPVAGQSRSYDFDSIGNRKTGYTVNEVNQYTQRTVPASIPIYGETKPTAAVNVNGVSVTANAQNGYFHADVPASNTVNADYVSVTATATLGGTATANLGDHFVAKTPEIFTHDDDGNLTQDGRWTYTWNTENRLIEMETLGTLPVSVPRRKLVFSYDYQGRRVTKEVYDTTSGTTLLEKRYFVYDGWNLVNEYIDGSLSKEHVWGLDLSQTMQGAGGVGGLLATVSGATTEYVAYDGNGNVMALVDAASGSPSATYEYDPFGGLIRKSGASAEDNVFRFSTKYQDVETGLSYYGYRYYDAVLGRWLNRDPIGEESFFVDLARFSREEQMEEERNLNRFVGNNPVGKFDELGLYVTCGKVVRRAIDPRSFNRVQNLFTACFTPHWFIIAEDGSRYASKGTTDQEDHWTATIESIKLRSGVKCDDFNKCLKAYFGGITGLAWHPCRNCQTSVKEAIEKCGGLLPWQGSSGMGGVDYGY